jgi:hypothetical protein
MHRHRAFGPVLSALSLAGDAAGVRITCPGRALSTTVFVLRATVPAARAETTDAVRYHARRRGWL